MARKVNPAQDRQRRAALEQAAYLAIYECGFSGVTLAAIGKQADVSAGTLIYHFGSRAGLLSAVMRRFTRTFTVATRRALRSAETPTDKLCAYVDNQFFSLESSRRFYTVSLDFLAAATREAQLMQLQREFLQQRLELDTELVAHLSPSLELSECKQRAKLLRALIEGLSVRFLAEAAPNLDDYRQDCRQGIVALLSLEVTGNNQANNVDPTR